MNAREAMETISRYLDMFYNQGLIFSSEIQELGNAEKVIYNFLDSMEVE